MQEEIIISFNVFKHAAEVAALDHEQAEAFAYFAGDLFGKDASDLFMKYWEEMNE